MVSQTSESGEMKPRVSDTLGKALDTIRVLNGRMMEELEVEVKKMEEEVADDVKEEMVVQFCEKLKSFQEKQKQSLCDELTRCHPQFVTWKKILVLPKQDEGSAVEGRAGPSAVVEESEDSDKSEKEDDSDAEEDKPINITDTKTQMCGLELMETQKPAYYDYYTDDNSNPDAVLEAAANETPEPTIMESLEPTLVEPTPPAVVDESRGDEKMEVDDDENVTVTAASSNDAVTAASSGKSQVKLKDCCVRVERLDEAVLETIKREGKIYVEAVNQSADGRNSDRELLKDLARLQALNAKMDQGNTPVKAEAKTKPSQSKSSSTQKKANAKGWKDDDARRCDEDSSDTDWSESESQFLTQKVEKAGSSNLATVSKNAGVPNSNPDTKESESDSDSDYREVGSDDEEARKSVLRGTRSCNTDDSARKSDSKPELKKEKKSYYTPRVARLNYRSDSDSEDSVKGSPLKIQSKRRILMSDSDSDGGRVQKKKLKAEANTVDLCSDSESQLNNLDKTIADMTTDEEAEASDKSGSGKSKKRTSELPEKTKQRRRAIMCSSDSENDDFKEFRQGNTGSSQKVKIEKLAGPKPSSSAQATRRADAEVITLSDSEEDNSQSVSRRGRRNIREILDRSAWSKETQEANAEEEERRKRLAKRQAEFNESFQVPELDMVEAADAVLDFDSRTKEPLVTIDPSLVKKLKSHQASGVRFMWDNCFESVEQYNKPWNQGSGCILAHCMGLGKTFQAVTFVHTILTCDHLKDIKTVLIICPLSTVHNWYNEFQMWLANVSKPVRIYKLYDLPPQKRVSALEAWKRRGGVGIIAYNMFRLMVDEKKMQEKLKRGIISEYDKKKILECLIEPGPSVVICDEGHLLKNHESKLSINVNRIKTRRRVILTGTPLQNNLMEYHTMMSFVKPNLLGTRKEFANRFKNPITNGQHKDSTPTDVRIMKKRAHVLHKLLEPSVQRRDYSILTPYLPPKYEYTVIIHMSEIQKKLYNAYLGLLGNATEEDVIGRIQMGYFFGDFAMVSKIWSHPFNLTRPTVKDKAKKKKGVPKDESEEEAEDLENEAALLPKSLHPKAQVSKEMELFRKRHGDWWTQYFERGANIKAMEHSTKFIILMDILKTCDEIGDKVLVFSQYLYSLDLIEDYFKLMDDEAREKILEGEEVPRWRKGIEYYRLDGSVPSAVRQQDCEKFNAKDSKAKLYLISTRAGGLGINLVGANRVVLFDASFNPANDLQGIFRVYRFGQKKPCYIYRLVAKGAMEEKVYNRQVVKLSLAGRVVDEQQIQRHFTLGELIRMYDPIGEEPPLPRPLPPKDRLLAELLCSQSEIIATYLEHDSLLQNQVDEKLTDEERKLAWEEFENEKKGRVFLQNLDDSFEAVVGGARSLTFDTKDLIFRKLLEKYPQLDDGTLQSRTESLHRDILTLAGLEILLSTTNLNDKEGRKKYEELKTKITETLGDKVLTEALESVHQSNLATPRASTSKGSAKGPASAPRANQTKSKPSIVSSSQQRKSQNQPRILLREPNRISSAIPLPPPPGMQQQNPSSGVIPTASSLGSPRPSVVPPSAAAAAASLFGWQQPGQSPGRPKTNQSGHGF